MEDRPFLYSHQPKPYSNELELRLSDTDLSAIRGRSSQHYPLKDIEQIRLFFSPRNIARLAFSCEVRARDGNSVTFDNVSWRSLIDVERADGAYRTFVLSLVSRAQQANPDVVLVAGIAPWRYRLMQVVGVAIAGCLIASLVIAWRSGGTIIALAAFGLAAYFGLWMRDFLTRNRPRHFAPDQPPEGALPTVNAS